MDSTWTPEHQRHRLLPAEREAFDSAQSQGVLPAGWTPLQGEASTLWVGPGLTVARGSEGMPFTLVEGAEARQLLIAHAFRATPDQRRRLADAAAPGTPMAEAVGAIAAAFPGFRPVDVSATGALFACVPHALPACDGKYGELGEGVRLQHTRVNGLAQRNMQCKANWRSVTCGNSVREGVPCATVPIG